MALIVQKFGGTSVGSIERIRNVAWRVAKWHEAGHRLVVVPSAMAGETNRLLGLAALLQEHPDPRELDVIASTGEQVSVGLLAMALLALGIKAKSYTGWQVRVLTDSAFTRARIMKIDEMRLRQDLENGCVAVVAGFQGVDPEGSITTLGRGGSDTSAVALAAALGADECQIYTDVDGVYTSDPNVVPNARKVARISYEEMLELASLGAKVLQIRSVEFGMKYGVKIHVRSSFNTNEGTWVVPEEKQMEAVLVSGVTADKNEAKVTLIGVPDKPGTAAKIFQPLSEANIIVDMIIQNISDAGRTDLTFTVPRADVKRAVDLIKRAVPEMAEQGIKTDDNIAKVSVVGVGMRSHAGVALRTFEILAREGINILMISTSEIKISVVVEAKYAELAVRVLHDGFDLGKPAA
ncbi:MAG TPA: aspartate kinase [Polyangia bacterium]|nr:aspartate kinase [Polyangia bacterium]